MRFLGIDFSGGSGPWKANAADAQRTVWIAILEGYRLADLLPVQDLSPNGEPFDNLLALLREGDFRAAAIDAPFSIPEAHLPCGTHAGLLAAVRTLPNGPGRPFPSGDALFALAQSVRPFDASRKMLRETERLCGANARSTLWNGGDGSRKARPGTPFAAACLSLISRAGRPIWPWSEDHGMLVEAFPAAQLRHWGLRHAGYGPPARERRSPAELALRRERRAAILDGVVERTRFAVPPRLRDKMLASADALDAFVAAFAGRAAANRQAKRPPVSTLQTEGLIAIHD